jgi:hypothetical protein
MAMTSARLAERANGAAVEGSKDAEMLTANEPIRMAGQIRWPRMSTAANANPALGEIRDVYPGEMERRRLTLPNAK